jgi:hypothetical protein
VLKAQGQLGKRHASVGVGGGKGVGAGWGVGPQGAQGSPTETPHPPSSSSSSSTHTTHTTHTHATHEGEFFGLRPVEARACPHIIRTLHRDFDALTGRCPNYINDVFLSIFPGQNLDF